MTAMPASLYAYPADLLATHDGDSFHLRIILSWGEFREARIRLARVNCDEAGTPTGDAATAWTNAWLDEGVRRVTELPKRDQAHPFIVQTRIEDNHSRPLCEVWRKCDGVNLSDALLTAGQATKYTLLAL